MSQPKAYSYVRFSSKKQAKGESFNRQIDAAQAYCKREKISLDTSMTMHDLGVSAFKGGNVTAGALGIFLAAIENGRVVEGDRLIVESFDRISRQPPLDALQLITKILQSGIEIVTLMDGQTYTEESVNGAQIFVLQGILMRAHEESKTKSIRVRHAQDKGKEEARKTGKAWHGRPPTWIDKVDGKFKLNRKKSAIVKRMVRMSIDGIGPTSIAKTLNGEGVDTISDRSNNGWHYSVIKVILRNRGLIGEYQPRKTQTISKRIKGKKVNTSTVIADGEPIKDYYPAVIDEKIFLQLQSVMDQRMTGTRKRDRKGIVNLFGKILVSGQDGSTISVTKKGKSYRNMISMATIKGLAKTPSFPYDLFERHFLYWVYDVDLSGERQPDSSDEIEHQLNDIRKRIGKVEKAIEDGSDFERMLKLLSKMSKEEEGLVNELNSEKSKNSAPSFSETKNEIQGIVNKLNNLEGLELRNIREQLRSKIAQVVNQIKVHHYGGKSAQIRVCVAEIEFKTGDKRVFVLKKIRSSEPISVAATNRKIDFDRVGEAVLTAEDREAVRKAIKL